jgi:type IV pilus assembly protein PilP
MRRFTILLVTLGLGACTGGDLDDLRAFVAQTGKDMQGKIEPLPEVKVYEPFSYGAFDLSDPFKPRKLTTGGGGGVQPDFARPREPLETFSLETLTMVGVLAQQGVTHAVVRTPENAIYHVRVGNYMGQNFGRITQIRETEVTLRENVQDSAGDWSERTSSLMLQE